MTLAPDVLEELDFPTPEPTPEPDPLDRPNTLLEQILNSLWLSIQALPAIEQAPQLEPLDDPEIARWREEHYCWCSPNRTMLSFEGSFIEPVTLHTWYGRIGGSVV